MPKRVKTARSAGRDAPTPSTSDLRQIPGIGKTLLADFVRIGVTTIADLRGKTPEKLHAKLVRANAAVGHETSKNYLYVLRMASYFANGGRDEALLSWSAWTDARIKSRDAGATTDDRESYEPATRRAWRAWLKKNHRTSRGVWLVLRKKASGLPRVDLEAACEELVCFGWVDSRPAKLDAARSKLLCTPRSPRAAWSRLNKDRYERMEAAGKVDDAGRLAVELARETGRWAALDEVERLVIPPDLSEALAAHPSATRHFTAFPPSAKRGILEWIAQAKRPATRAARIATTAALAARNERANQWPRA